MTEEKKAFNVTAEDVELGIEELARLKPGVYSRLDENGEEMDGCSNLHPDENGVLQPSCIVGSYFAMRVGIENVEPNGNYDSTISDLVAKGLITITPEAKYTLRVAQRLQDTKKVSWEAIESVMFSLRAAALDLHEDLSQ